MIELLNGTTAKEWLFLLLGFIVGLLTNLFFYLISKNDKSEKNMDRLFDLYNKTINDSNREKEIQSKINDIKEKVAIKHTIAELNQNMETIKNKLLKEPTEDDIITYKALAVSWSDNYISKMNPKILSVDGSILLSSLLKFHRTIFPESFIFAGKLREVDVLITDILGTTANTLNTAVLNYNLQPIHHKEVEEELEFFCKEWNMNIQNYMKKNVNEKISIIAELHHKFQVIHPFLDGNGRVGRVLLSDMVEFLLKKKIDFNYEKEKYYMALKHSDLGDRTLLEEFIYNQIN